MTDEASSKITCDVSITISPASSRDELITKTRNAPKAAAQSKAPPPESPRCPCIPTRTVSLLTSVFERSWIWLFAFLLLISMALSILSLTQDAAEWLETSNGGRVGWRQACVDTQTTEDSTKIIVNCQPGDSVQPIEDVINTTAGHVSDSILAVSILAWVIPAATIAISTYCTSKETCCHGFSLSVFWGVTGSTLFFLTFWFGCLVNDHLTTQSHTLLSVSCLNQFNHEIHVCTDVTMLTSCLSKCKEMGDDIVCVGYRDCEMTLRETDCDRDGIGCEASMGWGMLASLASSTVMTVMAIVLALGSWTVSKHL